MPEQSVPSHCDVVSVLALRAWSVDNRSRFYPGARERGSLRHKTRSSHARVVDDGNAAGPMATAATELTANITFYLDRAHRPTANRAHR